MTYYVDQVHVQLHIFAYEPDMDANLPKKRLLQPICLLQPLSTTTRGVVVDAKRREIQPYDRAQILAIYMIQLENLN